MAEQRFVVVCPIARCAKLSVRDSREDAKKADRQHWDRVHEPKAVSSPNKEEGD